MARWLHEVEGPPVVFEDAVPSRGVVMRANALTGCFQCVVVRWPRTPSFFGRVPPFAAAVAVACASRAFGGVSPADGESGVRVGVRADGPAAQAAECGGYHTLDHAEQGVIQSLISIWLCWGILPGG